MLKRLANLSSRQSTFKRNMTFIHEGLKTYDPELHQLITEEKRRQFHGIELIASENFTTQAVLDANASILTNKYSEGLPGARYYGGNEFIDKIEVLCQKRCLEAFGLNETEWGVNVQPYSGSTANFAVLTSLLQPGDKLMGLDLPSGGHLTHGYQTPTKKLNASSIYFTSKSYKTNPESGLVDYDQLETDALSFRPKLIICGGSAYPQDWDYKRLRAIVSASSDKESTGYLWMDMAHTSGLISAGLQNNPFEYCDVVSTTTHKSLRGPRAAVIFYKKSLEAQVNFAVFPACQGGPHNHSIAGIAVAMKQANTPEFKQYCKHVIQNAKVLADRLMDLGYTLVTNGTANHLLLWDLRPQNLTGSKFEKLCEHVDISLNKNSVPGDKSAMSPGGVRIGTCAMTTRGLAEKDFVQVALFLDEAVKISLEIQSSSGKLLKDFTAALETNEKLVDLKKRIRIFSSKFEMPGIPRDEL